MNAPTERHRITEVRAFDASGPGALAGHEAICSCGHPTRTSLSAAVATREGNAHADFMNNRQRAATRVRGAIVGAGDPRHRTAQLDTAKVAR